MEESFELLSSMSPKVDRTKKIVRKKKGPTKLALKSSFRKSAIFDKFPHTNKDTVLIDSESSHDSSPNHIKKTPPIVIVDSEDEAPLIPPTKLLSNTKLDSIKQWVENIDTNGDVYEPEEWELTLLSHISSINANGNKNGFANSTFINQSDAFKELFTKFENQNSNLDYNDIEEELIKKWGKKESSKMYYKNGQELKELHNIYERNVKNILDNEKSKDEESFDSIKVIEDSFDGKKGSDVDEFFSIKDNNSGPGSKNDSIGNKENYFDIPGTPVNAQVDYNECKSVLDELYGNSWRKNKDKILPKSEPRPMKKHPNMKCPNTEIKTKNSEKLNNPYLDSEVKKSKNLLKTLQSARVKAALESPWLTRLNNLCDPDDSDDEIDKLSYVKTKLQFDDLEGETSKNSKNSQSSTSDINKYRSRKSSTSSSSESEKGKERKGSFSSSSSNWIDDDFSDDCLKSLKDKLKGKNKDNKSAGQKPKSFERNWTDEINNSLEEKLKTKLTFKQPATEPVKRNITKYKTPKIKSFLASLSKAVPDSECDASARIFRNNFKHYRDQLVTKLFKLFNNEIFGNCIPDDTPIEWSDRMTGTAGYCSCVKVTRRTGVIERKVKLKLATKILDSADRLRDTLVHEMCHAATWIANKVSDGHGSYWKAWASKAMKTFPELPPIKRCHDYAINTKYTYKCTGCGYSVGRHSKSLDLNRKRCGYCYGTFEVLINKTGKNGETKSVPSKAKELSGFALFVKENYNDFKSPGVNHKDIMKRLGQKYKELNVK